MSYVMWEEDVEDMSDVRDQLKLFADMSVASREITLSGEQLGCFMRRLAKELDRLLKTVDERGQKANKAHVRPFTLKRIIETISGIESAHRSDLGQITDELRSFAKVNENMRYARDAWEAFLIRKHILAASSLADDTAG